MSILKNLLPRWDEPYVSLTQKSYEELYGEQIRRKIDELRAAGKYLPEMEKPHWNRSTM